MNIIELNKICLKQGSLNFQDINLSVKAGDIVMFTGASGIGKSTLLNMLGLLHAPDSGEYKMAGQDMIGLSSVAQANIRNQSIGFVYQDALMVPHYSILQNVLLPLEYNTAPTGAYRKNALDLLAQFGLSEQLNQPIHTLSLGQQQRVALARALILKPKILLADEPTGSLDPKATENVMTLIQTIAKQGTTVLMSTHDTTLCSVANKHYLIKDNQLILQ